MAIRSFLAFELPHEIRSGISDVSIDLRKSGLNVKWVNVDNIHLTILFLGNIEEDDIHPMEDSIGKICDKYSSFDISLEGIGLFPDIRKPRVIWLGLGGNIDRMGNFRDDLQGILSPFGIKKENRAFKPHITLGRFRNPTGKNGELGKYLTRYRSISSPVYTVNELFLFKSELKPSGARYTRINSWMLTGKK